MASPYLVSAVRDAIGAGWRREREFTDSFLMVWKHESDLMVVVLEPGIASLRILRRRNSGLEIIADCKVDAWQTAVDILAAYGVFTRKHTVAYRAGRRSGLTEARHG